MQKKKNKQTNLRCEGSPLYQLKQFICYILINLMEFGFFLFSVFLFHSFDSPFYISIKRQLEIELEDIEKPICTLSHRQRDREMCISERQTQKKITRKIIH